MLLSKVDRKRRLNRLLPVVLLLGLAAAFAIDYILFLPPLEAFREKREMMDTWVSITVYARDPARAARAIKTAFSRMEEIERIASIYDEQAEAFQLNAHGRLDNPSPELLQIIAEARKTHVLSKGAFDITVEPLLELWRYKEGAQKQFWELAPAEQQEAIAKVQALVGSDKVAVITNPCPAIVLAPGTKITLGGIAKGYAVDQGLIALAAAGINHGLIDAGGDIGVFGGKPTGEAWEIELRNPNNRADYLARFALEDGAIATSGNYERYFDPAAKVGHIMDPRTGYSAHNASSATVIAPTCTQADALATAVFVLGPIEGINLVNTLEKVEALVIGYEEPTRLFRSDGLQAFERLEKGDL